jgi:hypothetical protein
MERPKPRLNNLQPNEKTDGPNGIKLTQQETFYLLRAIHYFEANMKHFSVDGADMGEVLCSLLNVSERGLECIRQIKMKAEDHVCPRA